MNDYEDILTDLIDAGADMNAKNDLGETPVWRAAHYGKHLGLQFLIAQGADVNTPNQYNITPLMEAASSGFDMCVDLLVRAGADVNSQGQFGETALTLAVERRYGKGVDILIAAGADVNRRDNRGDPLIIRAVKDRRYDYLDVFLYAGADVNVVDSGNNTPLMTLMKNRTDRKCVAMYIKVFLRAGAKVNTNPHAHSHDVRYHVTGWLPGSVNRKLGMLLLAAGEALDGTTVTVDDWYGNGSTVRLVPVPELLLRKDLRLSLRHLCRETIRKHLLQMSQVNLFVRVPLLGLPSLITGYLLYDVDLDE